MANNTPKNNLNKVRGSYFISVISITLVLFISGFTGLLIINTKILSDKAKDNIGFTVFFKNDTKPADESRVFGAIKVSDYAKKAEFITKEQAVEIMKKELGKDFTEVLGYNSLPNSIEVQLNNNFTSSESIKSIKQELLKFSSVKEVYYQESHVHSLQVNTRNLSFIGGIFTILLLIVSVTLISNTVRLSIYSKRFLIRTAQLSGATDNFIRKPFLVRNIISGILSASLASLALYFLILILQKRFDNIISIEGITEITLIVFTIGIAVTGISGAISVKKYLKLPGELLFFEN